MEWPRPEATPRPGLAPYGNRRGVPLRFLGRPRREGLGPLDELRKTGGVAHGHVRQNLAVDRDSGRLQAVDQLAVGDAVQTGSGTDALNPQTAVLPLADTAVALGITLRAICRFLGGLVKLALCEEEAFGPFEILLAQSPALCAAFYACHGVFFSFLLLEQGPSSGGFPLSRESSGQKARATDFFGNKTAS